jgi:hypothetical protein
MLMVKRGEAMQRVMAVMGISAGGSGEVRNFAIFFNQWLGQCDVEGVQTRILPWMLSTVECGSAERF